MPQQVWESAPSMFSEGIQLREGVKLQFTKEGNSDMEKSVLERFERQNKLRVKGVRLGGLFAQKSKFLPYFEFPESVLEAPANGYCLYFQRQELAGLNRSENLKLELIGCLAGQSEVKLELLCRSVSEVHVRLEESEAVLYLHLLLPPRFFVKLGSGREYRESRLHDMGMERVHNYTLLEPQERVDEMARLFVLKKSVLRLRCAKGEALD